MPARLKLTLSPTPAPTLALDTMCRLDVARTHSVRPSTRWDTILGTTGDAFRREPWNKGKIVGQKAPFKVKEIWALRVRLQMESRVRELALFNLGIDSKLPCRIARLSRGAVYAVEDEASR